MLGFAAGAGVWLLQRGIQVLAERRANAELRAGNRQRAMATVAVSTLGRVGLMATAVLLAGLAEREAGLASGDPGPGPLHGLLRRPGDRPPLRRTGGGQGMSTKAKVFIGLGVYLAIAILMLLIFGSSGKNEEFQPQNEFKLEPWVSIHLGGLDLSINKAVLYLVLASALTIFTMVWISRRMHAETEPGADRDRGRLRPDQEQHHRRQPRHGDGDALVPLPRRALLLDLVLEHDRLPAAADQHRAHGRRLRPQRSPRSRSTRRPPTSRSRWC